MRIRFVKVRHGWVAVALTVGLLLLGHRWLHTPYLPPGLYHEIELREAGYLNRDAAKIEDCLGSDSIDLDDATFTRTAFDRKVSALVNGHLNIRYSWHIVRIKKSTHYIFVWLDWHMNTRVLKTGREASAFGNDLEAWSKTEEPKLVAVTRENFATSEPGLRDAF